jgi:hypothetical protein
MTTPKQQSFEEMVETEIENDKPTQYAIDYMTKYENYHEGYTRGASFGRSITVHEILEMLRQARNSDGSYLGAAKAKDMRTTADWLETEMKKRDSI